jgi:hypothetical protein
LSVQHGSGWEQQDRDSEASRQEGLSIHTSSILLLGSCKFPRTHSGWTCPRALDTIASIWSYDTQDYTNGSPVQSLYWISR